MSNDFLTVGLPLLGVIGLVDLILLYASYLSFLVWRGLAVLEFKSRALWMALFGIPISSALAYGTASFVFLPSESPFAAPFISDIIFSIGLFTVVIWIDRIVGSAIRMDFLRRDLLSWRRYRVAYYALFIVSSIIHFSSYAGVPNALPISILFLLIDLGYGILALAKGTRRTLDATFKNYMKWFGYLGGALVPVLVIWSLTQRPTVIIGIPLIAVSFCFYRMARNLVPIGKLHGEDPVVPANN
jgi:hypothetical protein